MWRIVGGAIALLCAVEAKAQEDVPLKAGAGRETVEANCNACHSLDYPRQNSQFLSRQAWEAEVSKMIKAFGAPIDADSAKIIIDYLSANYGTGS
jgi:mono/diheme cytochrome c family protein